MDIQDESERPIAISENGLKLVVVRVVDGVATLFGDVPPGVRLEIHDYTREGAAQKPSISAHDGSDECAASALVHAYAAAGDEDGSVKWEDVDRAYRLAQAELGPERCQFINGIYREGAPSEPPLVIPAFLMATPGENSPG